MKYKENSIVVLNSGESMLIYEVDEKNKHYYAVGCDDQEDSRVLSDSDIYQQLMNV